MSTRNDSASADAGIDLSQFYQVFFEEAQENLDNLEHYLLSLNLAQANDEELNAIFRCAHSIKGGAATFGFADVAELTHQMETLLDKLRRHELQPDPAMVDVLLLSGDALKNLLARHQGVGSAAVDVSELVGRIQALAEGRGAPAPAAAAPATAKKGAKSKAAEAKPAEGKKSGAKSKARPASAATDTPATEPAPPAAAGAGATDDDRVLEMLVGPLADPQQADALLDLFKEIADLGQLELADPPSTAQGLRRFKLVTHTPEAELLDLFSFHVAREHVKFSPWGAEVSASAATGKADTDKGYGFFDDAPGAPAPRPATPAADVAKTGKPATLESSTLRVSVEKVDQLINLVGELVITQAMLAQNSRHLDPVLHQQLMAGLSDLDRNTRDLQESVMSIRMIPMSVVFNRFPRMLRDLAQKLGKNVELVTMGESTELDKGLVEKITDPLTHLVRNACDHGIESSEERVAKGKSPTGTIMLSASHQGGSIVIEVSDDGKGLSRAKLLQKAGERGMAVHDGMSDAEVWNLIFEPGFSTAEQLTDISGRGVGMDVVKRNITALGGSVEIESIEGQGMRVSVRLPLTLAIMDGMSVGVGDEIYILPLQSVVESFQVTPDMIKTVGGSGRVVQVRDAFMPVIELDQLFKVPRDAQRTVPAIMVVVEAEAGRIAMVVDELLGQQQIVVKNLEANYRKVNDISGATIMGDGRVALILDVSSLVRRSRH